MLDRSKFDLVNRDLEIRSCATGKTRPGRAGLPRGVLARLNANLAFWDGLDGKTDWPQDQHGAHPLTEFVLAAYPGDDATKPYVELGSFLAIGPRPGR